MKKLNDGYTLPAVTSSTANGKKASEPSTGTKKPRAIPAKVKPKSDAVIAAEGDTSDADMGNTSENDNDAEADVDTPVATTTPAANAAKKRARKAPAALDLDAESSPIVTPSAKRARVQKPPELDADGQPISTPKGGRKPKTDADGNPIKPTPRARKPKEKADENGNPKPVRTRKAPVPKNDENGVEVPVNKGGRKSNAAIAAEAKAKADLEALMERTEADEQLEDEKLATTVLSVFEQKGAVKGGEDADEGRVVIGEKVVQDAVLVKKDAMPAKEEVASVGSDDAEMLDDGEDNDGDGSMVAQHNSDEGEDV